MNHLYTPEHPEKPARLAVHRKARYPVRAVVVGERGTTATAHARGIVDATTGAQEAFWRTTAEGAYQ